MSRGGIKKVPGGGYPVYNASMLLGSPFKRQREKKASDSSLWTSLSHNGPGSYVIAGFCGIGLRLGKRPWQGRVMHQDLREMHLSTGRNSGKKQQH